MKENKILKDDELEKVSWGILVDNWKEILGSYAELYRNKGSSFKSFKGKVLNGKFDDEITLNGNGDIDGYEERKIIEYLESIKWE